MLDMATSSLVPFDTESVQSEQQTIVERYASHIQPFWQKKVSHGVFGGVGGVEISYAYALHPRPAGSIAISSGRIESLVKYKELMFNLYHAGYSVFIHDHRGQGLSGRMTDNPQQGYVARFDDYVADFKTFFDKVIVPKSLHRPKLLCHSMGGAIGALYALKHPDDFSQIALTAPMFGIKPALPRWLACLLIHSQTWFYKLLNDKPTYFWGQGDYTPEAFEHNKLTHSAARYKLFRQEYDAQPQVKLGGVTNIWLEAALLAMDEIADQAGNLNTPVLLLQAGADQVVDNRAQEAVAIKLGNCEKHLIEGAKHELLMEADLFRDASLRYILDFFTD